MVRGFSEIIQLLQNIRQQVLLPSLKFEKYFAKTLKICCCCLLNTRPKKRNVNCVHINLMFVLLLLTLVLVHAKLTLVSSPTNMAVENIAYTFLKLHSDSSRQISYLTNRLTLQCLVSTKRSHILKQTCSFQLQVCLSVCDL